MGLSLNACYYDTFPEEEIDVPEPGEEVSYSENIQPLWDKDCVSCHKGTTAPDLRPDVSYNDLIDNGWVVKGDAAASILYQSLIGAPGVVAMPTPASDFPWSPTKIKLVEDWINEGAQNN